VAAFQKEGTTFPPGASASTAIIIAMWFSTSGEEERRQLEERWTASCLFSVTHHCRLTSGTSPDKAGRTETCPDEEGHTEAPTRPHRADFIEKSSSQRRGNSSKMVARNRGGCNLDSEEHGHTRNHTFQEIPHHFIFASSGPKWSLEQAGRKPRKLGIGHGYLEKLIRAIPGLRILQKKKDWRVWGEVLLANVPLKGPAEGTTHTHGQHARKLGMSTKMGRKLGVFFVVMQYKEGRRKGRESFRVLTGG